MYRNVYGLDLGSSEIKIYDEKQNKIWKEKSVVVKTGNNRFTVCGTKALHSGSNEEVGLVRPLTGGAVACLPELTYLLRAILPQGHFPFQGPQYVVAVPAGLTEIERQTYEGLSDMLGCRRKDFRLFEHSFLDAAGCGIHFESAPGTAVVNLGAETIEISILSHGEQIVSRRLKSGAGAMDRAIRESVLKQYGI